MAHAEGLGADAESFYQDALLRPDPYAGVVFGGWGWKMDAARRGVFPTSLRTWGYQPLPITLVQLEIVKGQVFVGEKLLRREAIAEFLNVEIKASKEPVYVMIFPAEGSTIGDLMPTLDECRKSQAERLILTAPEGFEPVWLRSGDPTFLRNP